ncbi:anti-sigma factor [Cryptosporangium phraense]|uniref:Regulator of SigK n=1 Tax=Cryptosporangium phraense TaxID=2593070 RepID=A0A545ARY2_9ACTN|nr:anti-sigma factor [Cryptosporangium phraense]TQS44098.1 anti-sigma factor [Cryptosporangium phraense]
MTSNLNGHLDQLLGVYALNALDDVERATVERHLRICPTCADEAAELVATTARLGSAERATPPADLRGRVLASARRTPQQHGRPAARANPAAARWRRGLVAGAAAVVLGGSVGGTWWAQQDRIADEHARVVAAEQENATMRAVLAAADARLRVAPDVPSGRLTAVYSPSQRTAVVTFGGLGDVPADRTYQLWRLAGGTPESLGALPVGSREGTLVVRDLGATDRVAVSVERAGGSRTPSNVFAAVAMA